MSKPAARLTDMHLCPMQTPAVVPIPHVGGPIVGPGVPTVLIAGLPAATVGDMCICVGPPDVIVLGSFTVLTQGKPTARMGDMTAHLGSIVGGCPTVMVGDAGGGAGSPQANTMAAAKAVGAPFVPMSCAASAVESALKGTPLAAASAVPAAPGGAPGPGDPTPDKKPSWVEIELTDQHGKPVPYERYRVTAPGRSPIEGFLNDQGLARVDGIDPGTCTVTFPELDGRLWKPA